MNAQEFADRVSPKLTGRRVQLEPWFEPERIAFFESAPDRLVAGHAAFDALVAGGYEPVGKVAR